MTTNGKLILNFYDTLLTIRSNKKQVQVGTTKPNKLFYTNKVTLQTLLDASISKTPLKTLSNNNIARFCFAWWPKHQSFAPWHSSQTLGLKKKIYLLEFI